VADPTPPPLPESTKQIEARLAELEAKKADDWLTAEEKAELRALLKAAKAAPPPTPPKPAPDPAPTEGKSTERRSWPW
jgi:hypothetical protein